MGDADGIAAISQLCTLLLKPFKQRLGRSIGRGVQWVFDLRIAVDEVFQYRDDVDDRKAAT